MKNLIKSFAITFLVLLSLTQGISQSNTVYIDDNGVMRWGDSREEVTGFGVNYTVPFAHAYRSAKKLGIDPKKAIDNDIYHFTRLGFDLYRIHVWDTEISDTLGNLIENENLDAFDYLLSKLKENNINYVLTPIAFWGNGWPDPDEPTPGFSYRYGKGGCLTNPNCISAQENYLAQFISHVNPYTGVAYKDDPNLIAFEVSNEPHHRGEGSAVTAFVKGMVESMQKTGNKKPIFYNISHAVHFAEDYFKAGIQGGTFQWYPTGLGYQRELSGNMLPNTANYDIPFDQVIKKYKGAKLVYEFDAADIGKSYIYPAMARSFRQAGIQVATHFAYDPTFLAPYNTEYNTHYMNLNYAPQKALSLMISAEVFRKVPLYKDHGLYPNNNQFGDFRVNYEEDLATYNSIEKFIYTNHTDATPVNEKKLNLIAGYGNSQVVEYTGKGAYFLDKIGKGVWRLEVMPDAVWVDNVFGRNSLDQVRALINWKAHDMAVYLNELGTNFSIEAINDGNVFTAKVKGNSFKIYPGTYILSKKGISQKWKATDAFKTHLLKDFYAPKTTVKQAWFNHKPYKEISEGQSVSIDIQYTAPELPNRVQMITYTDGVRETYDMTTTREGYIYSASLPESVIKRGLIYYSFRIENQKGEITTFPKENAFNLRIVPSSYPIHLFDASQDIDLLVRPWRNGFKSVPTTFDGELGYQMNLEKLFVHDNENENAEPLHVYSFKHFISDRIEGRKNDLKEKEKLVFKGNSLNEKPCMLEISLILKDGSAFGKIVEIGTELKEYRIALNELTPTKTVTLPRPYPTFLPYYFEHQNTGGFRLEDVESLQFSIGPGIPETELEQAHGIEIVKVRLE